ncbi:uncharacterized protein LOC103176678 isoform X1 [Callorhinchus milii]|uniref:uncharacterized protein LOC103176678 isoform X1 n=1 Tax=Callorhinchus milii TaxID=7868 RepID=UPI001C3F7024|nr:uncharacterized protein LOC103176678 isoform X1 [Callorhinchus milii]
MSPAQVLLREPMEQLHMASNETDLLPEKFTKTHSANILPPMSSKGKKSATEKEPESFFLSIYKDTEIFPSEKEKPPKPSKRKLSKKRSLTSTTVSQKPIGNGKEVQVPAVNQHRVGEKKKSVMFMEGSALTLVSYLSSADEISATPSEEATGDRPRYTRESRHEISLFPSSKRQGEAYDWIDFELQRRESLKVGREKRETENRERRMLLNLRHMERMKKIAGHVQKVFTEESVQMRAPRTPLLVKGQMLSSMYEPQSMLSYRAAIATPPRMPSTIPPAMPCSSMVSKPQRLKSEQPYSMFIIIRDTYAPPKMPAPTPMEKRLLRERFPQNKIPSTGLEPELIERRIYTPSMTRIYIPKEQQSKKTFIERFPCQ